MVIPMMLMAQNELQKIKLTVRSLKINTSMNMLLLEVLLIPKTETRTDFTKKKAKKGDKFYSYGDVKGYMKHIQKSRWAINFDFGRTKSKEAQLVMKNEFYSMIDALNFLGERGFELVLSEVQKTPHGDMQIYHMRKPR